MIRGYARVSTEDQRLRRQTRALNEAGADKIYCDHKSGRNTNRPGLRSLMGDLVEGDVVLVVSLDRLGRSTTDLISISEELRDRGVALRSIDGTIDTSTPAGRCYFTIISAFAQMEREMAAERTRDGLAAAKAKGVRLGRPPVDRERLEAAMSLYADGSLTVARISETTGVSETRIYREARARGIRKGDGSGSSRRAALDIGQ